MASRDIEQQLMELKQRFLEDQIGPQAYQAERAERNLCLPAGR